MERLAQLPPPELEKLPNSTKVRCANAQFAALPDFNHGVPNTGASTTNTSTYNVRNVRIARSNSWSICRHVQSQRMAV